MRVHTHDRSSLQSQALPTARKCVAHIIVSTRSLTLLRYDKFSLWRKTVCEWVNDRLMESALACCEGAGKSYISAVYLPF